MDGCGNIYARGEIGADYFLGVETEGLKLGYNWQLTNLHVDPRSESRRFQVEVIVREQHCALGPRAVHGVPRECYRRGWGRGREGVKETAKCAKEKKVRTNHRSIPPSIASISFRQISEPTAIHRLDSGGTLSA